jgi:hypothetical protein
MAILYLDVNRDCPMPGQRPRKAGAAINAAPIF